MLHMSLGAHPTRARERAFNEYLALKVRSYWKERGHSVNLAVVEETIGRGGGPNGRLSSLTSIRSDMVNGRPVQRS